eukprot:2722448-Ditylum_brightwellii.AAC.1
MACRCQKRPKTELELKRPEYGSPLVHPTYVRSHVKHHYPEMFCSSVGSELRWVHFYGYEYVSICKTYVYV